MDALRVRLGSALEWVIAATFLGATFAVGSLILHEMRVSRPIAAPQVARPVAIETPASIPAGAVSVPVLPFADGKEIHVGDTAPAVAARLGRAAETGRLDVDRGALGERHARFYEYAGFRFIVLYEPFERKGEPRIAAIYLP
jgi:hypothetical protein